MRNPLKYIFLILLLGSMREYANSQVIADYNDISIFLGDKQKSSANVENFIKTKSGDLLCIQNQTSFTGIFSRYNSKYSFNFITDYSLPELDAVTFYGKGKKSSLTHYTILGDNILGLSSQTTFMNKESKLFYHFINPYAQGKSNHGFSLDDNFHFNQNVDISRITLKSSEDKKYASLIYVKKSSPEDYSSIKYLNFKEGSSVPEGGEFIYPFLTKDYEFLDFYIENEKSQFIVAGHFFKAQPRNNFIIQEKYFQSLSIGKIENQELKYEIFEGDGNYFTDVGFYNDEEHIIISGLYSPFIDGNVIGVFTIKLDSNGKVIHKNYSPFSNDLANSIAGLNSTFMEDRNTIKNEYKGFEFLHFETLEDGYIGIAEFNALEYRFSGTDVPGASSTVDSYFWSNDVIVFKLNLNGEIEWNAQVPKYQRSINDGGYFLSSAFYISDEKIHLFFNDNLLNYDQDGDYNQNGDEPFATQFNAGKNTIGHVSIDIENGFTERRSTIGKEESDLLFIPQLSTQFNETKKLMIYARSGNRHRVGSISF